MKYITIQFRVPDNFDDPSEVKLEVRDLLLRTLEKHLPTAAHMDEQALAAALLAEED